MNVWNFGQFLEKVDILAIKCHEHLEVTRYFPPVACLGGGPNQLSPTPPPQKKKQTNKQTNKTKQNKFMLFIYLFTFFLHKKRIHEGAWQKYINTGQKFDAIVVKYAKIMGSHGLMDTPALKVLKFESENSFTHMLGLIIWLWLVWYTMCAANFVLSILFLVKYRFPFPILRLFVCLFFVANPVL